MWKGKPRGNEVTGQWEEASLGFYDYGARPYDPALGRFLQADTLVPEPGNPQSLNRYAYTLNNPLRYTDPSGHFAWIPFLAVGGAIFTGITYCVTSDTFNSTESALAIGAGLVGGALIGTGVGAIAAASAAVIPSVTTMQMATIAIGAGTGGLASAEGYMFTTDNFDNTDFAIRTTLGGVEGGLTSAMKNPFVNTFVSTGFAAGESVISDIAHQRSINGPRAARAAAAGFVAGAVGEGVSGGFSSWAKPAIEASPDYIDLTPLIMQKDLRQARINAAAQQATRRAVRNTLRDTVLNVGEDILSN
ncbi:MAG TPA: RHS repeat-associated core domain-containing protein [Anaerolineae bacterium]|nr:RHS repeat-associated core domain-containing protein [Anaerolineae bacterium]